jgi:hypothetical protein
MESEAAWLRYRIIRMRTALRFAMSPEVENILRELITDAESRLAELEDQAGPLYDNKVVTINSEKPTDRRSQTRSPASPRRPE